MASRFRTVRGAKGGYVSVSVNATQDSPREENRKNSRLIAKRMKGRKR